MNKTTKVFTLILLLTAFTPSVTFAAWWNPLSWNWTNFFNTSTQTTVQSTTTSTIQTPTITENSSTTTAVSVVSTPTTTPIVLKKTTKKVSIPIQSNVTQNVVMTSVVSAPIPQTAVQPTIATTTVVSSPQPSYLPTISSVFNGVISGQYFTTANSVYIYNPNLGQVPLKFSVLNATTINLQSTSNPSYASGGQYNLFVINAYGVSAPFPIIAQQSTLGTSAACQQAEQNVQSLTQQEKNIQNQQYAFPTSNQYLFEQATAQTVQEEANLASEMTNASGAEQAACQ